MRRPLAIVTLIVASLVSCAPPQHAATPTFSPSSQSPSPVIESPTPSLGPPPPSQRMESSLPVALEESAATAADGKLYVMGGFDAAGNSLRSVWAFDGAAWSAGPGLPIGLD